MFRKLFGDRRGSVLPTFAVASIPLVAAMGAAVDFTRSYDERQIVQDALDSAVLAAGKQIGVLTTDEIKAEANKFYLANIQNRIANVPTLTTTVNASTIVGTAQLHVPTYFLGIVGFSEIVFNVKATATLAMGTIEVALVLDNSTSMNTNNNIATLRTAATSLVNTLYALGSTSTEPDPVKIALVPFAGSVNVGSSNASASWMDTGASGTYHADAMEAAGAPAGVNNFTLFNSLKDSSGDAITWGGCVEARPMPNDTTDAAADSSVPGTLFVPMFAADDPDNWTCSTGSCDDAPSSGGSSSNRRYNGAPTGSQSYNNYLPDSGTATTCPAAFPTITSVSTSSDTLTSAGHGLTAGTQVMFSSTGSLPGGLSSTTTYYVISSGLTSNAFKVSTSSGGSAVNITSSGSGTKRFTKPANWTCQSGNANCGGSGNGKSESSGFAGINISGSNLCKYGTPSNKATVSSITVSFLNGGPNHMCTTQAITPLTTSQSTVTGAISTMLANGTTNIQEGLMWGWRALSEGAPFTEGRAKTETDNQKILILMTDGENTYFPKTNSTLLKSWYGAWGYIARNHLGTTSTDQDTIQEKMDERTALACTNAKTDGIQIYVVAFNGTGGIAEATQQMLEACASDEEMYYLASDQAGLLAAFTAIGDDISLLRVSE